MPGPLMRRTALVTPQHWKGEEMGSYNFFGTGSANTVSSVVQSSFSTINSGSIGVPSSMSMVGAVKPTFAPLMQTLSTQGLTPTVAQFLNAANAEYTTSGTPPDMQPFMQYGLIPIAETNNTTGMAAKAYLTTQGQVIIAYQGTSGGDNLLNNFGILGAQLSADGTIYTGKISTAQTNALTFAQQVVQYANSVGIASSDVFVTGHSLGGIEAEYVAQQTGLGGIGFESTGIPTSTTAVGNGSNFINIVTYGDPVGSYASDVQGLQPYAPAYVPGQAGALPHFGQVVLIGDPSAQATLTKDVATFNEAAAAKGQITGGNLGDLLNLAGGVINYHLPGVQAHDLGVTLSPVSFTADHIGVMTGPVFQASSMTISQFLQSYSAANPGQVYMG